MGTKGIIYIYYEGTGTRDVLMVKYDGRTELLRIRREFMKLNNIKATDKLIASLKANASIEDLSSTSPAYLEAKDCWPFLEYSLEVSISEFMRDGKRKLNYVAVELVNEVQHHDEKTGKKTLRPFFVQIKGQRRQKRQ